MALSYQPLKLCRCRQLMKSIKVCEYSRSGSFHDDLILQDQASGERSQDQWSSGILCYTLLSNVFRYTLDEFGTARRTAVVRGLIDALTRGGMCLYLHRNGSH